MNEQTIKNILSSFRDLDALINERMENIAELWYPGKSVSWYGQYQIVWNAGIINGDVGIDDGYDTMQGMVTMPFARLWDDNYLATEQAVIDKRHAVEERRRLIELSEENRRDLEQYEKLKAKFAKPVDNAGATC